MSEASEQHINKGTSMKPNDGSGYYLATLQERDIDLFLREEFHISSELQYVRQ